MGTRELYNAIMEYLDGFPRVSYTDKIAALALAQYRLSNICLRSGGGDAPSKAQDERKAKDATDVGENLQEKIKEAVKRKGGRASLKEDGSVGVTYDKGQTWKNYKAAELKGLLSELLYA